MNLLQCYNNKLSYPRSLTHSSFPPHTAPATESADIHYHITLHHRCRDRGVYQEKRKITTKKFEYRRTHDALGTMGTTVRRRLLSTAEYTRSHDGNHRARRRHRNTNTQSAADSICVGARAVYWHLRALSPLGYFGCLIFQVKGHDRPLSLLPNRAVYPPDKKALQFCFYLLKQLSENFYRKNQYLSSIKLVSIFRKRPRLIPQNWQWARG